ncbi:EF-hand calcium-binding domain-containing protein 14 [Microcaecilia unicolor]|uniref:EF-hand calcium-binding domain-containing protein 14 n=1 Tax=Microcaecilia unicolor TaxID=1415580 RepID=A0A6P7Y3R5_9AMPH|nr:EF-hand calcium-binding domain-containing protein 14 [Microcaecilia unicolor]
MKKRKELNALIGLAGDGRRKKTKKGSGHRLLRTEPPASDSESSSEEDEFGQPGEARAHFSKGDYLRCCKICYPLCAFVILAACVVACVGLVWMQVALKEDLDILKEKLRAMESNQKSSFQEIPKLNEDLLIKQKLLENIKSGDMGLNKIWVNITEMNKQIALLASAVSHLKANVKSASDLLTLPNTVEELQKSVATIGSTLTSVHQNVETFQAAVDEQKTKMETLQHDVAELVTQGSKNAQERSPSSTVAPGFNNQTQSETFRQDILSLHITLDDINATLVQFQKQNDLVHQNADAAITSLSQRVSRLENTLSGNKTDRRENLTIGAMDNGSSFQRLGISNETGLDSINTKNIEARVSKLREKLQQINALTGKPESDKQAGDPETGENIQAASPKPTPLAKFSVRSLGNSEKRENS